VRDEPPGLGIDLEDCRVREHLRGARLEPPARPMEDEHVAVSVDVHAWHFPELNAGRKPGPILHLLIAGDWSGGCGEYRKKARSQRAQRDNANSANGAARYRDR